jgi:branched-chain amino acid transport system ATP-binding protein
MTARLEMRGVSKRFAGLLAIDDVAAFPTELPKRNHRPQRRRHDAQPDHGTHSRRRRQHPTERRPDQQASREISRRGIGRAFQVASLFPTFSVLDSLTQYLSHRARLWDAFGDFLLPTRSSVPEIMEMAGLRRHADKVASSLSHGDQKLLDIALALALEPSVLLLDEPTAGMGRDEARLMMERIQRMWEAEKITLIFIEHDMDIVFGIAQSVHVLRHGALLAEGTPQEVREHAAVIDAYLGSAN